MAKQKRKDSLEAMVALDHAYGRTLTRRRQFKLGAVPAIYITAYVGSMTLDWKIGAITFGLSLLGCYFWLLPKAVRAEYDAEGLNQRNLLLNQLSQSLADTSVPYQFRLQSARDSITGSIDPNDENFNQLKRDVDTLITSLLQDDSGIGVHLAFEKFMTRYDDDAIFALFFEQVETLAESGFMDAEIINSLRDQHNDLYREHLNYVAVINQKRTEFFVMSTYTLGVVILLMTSLIPVAGKAEMDKIFMHGIFGVVVIGVFITCFVLLLRAFYNRFFDRSLTTFGKGNKDKKKPVRNKPQAVREREIRKFVNKPVNRWLYSSISGTELGLMREQQLTVVQMIKFQYNRFITMFVVALVVGATATAFTKPLYSVIVGLVGAIAFYIYKAVDLRRGLADFRLARSMAFAKFTRLLIPYLKAPSGRNSYTMFENVSRRLDDDGDKQMVYGLMNDIRDNPDTPEPYTSFAKRFTGDQRSIAYMQAIYGVLNTRGSNDVIDSLAKQANQEFMAKVHEVVYKKLNKYNAFIGANILIAMIPIFGIIAAFVFQAIVGTALGF